MIDPTPSWVSGWCRIRTVVLGPRARGQCTRPLPEPGAAWCEECGKARLAYRLAQEEPKDPGEASPTPVDALHPAVWSPSQSGGAPRGRHHDFTLTDAIVTAAIKAVWRAVGRNRRRAADVLEWVAGDLLTFSEEMRAELTGRWGNR